VDSRGRPRKSEGAARRAPILICDDDKTGLVVGSGDGRVLSDVGASDGGVARSQDKGCDGQGTVGVVPSLDENVGFRYLSRGVDLEGGIEVIG